MLSSRQACVAGSAGLAMRDAYDDALVMARLEDAGRTLMALQVPGCRPAGYRSGMPEIVRELTEAYGWDGAELRTGPPSSSAIGRMDQALSWVGLLPADRLAMRRIVLMRMLVNPVSDRHVFSWRRMAAVLRCSHEAVRGWHEVAIGMIVGRLNAPGFCAVSGGRVGPSAGVVAAVVARQPVRSARRVSEPA